MKAARLATLLDHSGRTVRRCEVPGDAPFVLNLKDGKYYDFANETTYVELGHDVDFLSVACPVCDAWPDWACGTAHVDPVHRSRIVAALENHYNKQHEVTV